MDERAAKRRRLSSAGEERSGTPLLKSLTRAISPPPKKTQTKAKAGTSTATSAAATPRIASPFQLTAVRDLAPACNADAVALGDLLGDPLIAECWEFNYLHDVDFLMRHLDRDTRSLTKVHVVHGFWKREDPSRLLLEQQAARYDNVTLHTAFMPEMFGTHHAKMLILFRHDDSAQVVIHTANMIAKDWTNLTNGVWRSPRLPLLNPTNVAAAAAAAGMTPATIGSGARFKADLLAYLRAYNARRDVCRALVDALAKHDFSAVRGALVASVPGRHDVDGDPQATRWGWAGLQRALRSVPCRQATGTPPEIAVQVSSVATLGPTDIWLRRTLFEALSASKTTTRDSDDEKENDDDSSGTTTATTTTASKPEFRILFPTPDEIRASLDGYASGASIHMKTQSAQQQKQLAYMRPLLCHWANDTAKGVLQPGPAGDGGRKRAAPHIKTYIRYSAGPGPSLSPSLGSATRSIDWALLTSANLSKQAWGEATSGSSSSSSSSRLTSSPAQIRIASWEIGVLVWPDLLAPPTTTSTSTTATATAAVGEETERRPRAQMVATFKTDMPPDADADAEGQADGAALVALRVPYSLPLRRYAADEVPWVATARHREPDWMGRSW